MMNYTVEEVADMYFCGVEWVRTLIKNEKKEKGSGKFPNAFKPVNSRKWLIPEKDIEPQILKAWKETQARKKTVTE